MKKIIIIFSVFLFLSFSINTINVNAQTKTLKQGIYNAKDIGLLIHTPLTVTIDSPNSKAIIELVDSNQNIQELVRLNSDTPSHTIKPLDYDFSIIIFTPSSVTFS
jgi:hypothetical protein